MNKEYTDNLIRNLPRFASDKSPLIHYSDSRDRIYTYLTMMDYDWMHYRIQAEIPLEGVMMVVEFSYFGNDTSGMIVEIGDSSVEYSFSTDVFERYLKLYFDRQVEAIKPGTAAFYGGDLVLEFYNEVLEDHQNVTYENTEPIILPQN